MNLLLGFFSYFETLSFWKQLQVVAALWFFVFGVIGTIVLPIIFNFVVYPKIEKRLGMRLKKWSFATDIWLFGKFFLSYSVLCTLVVTQWFMLIFAKNPDEAIKKFNAKRAWATDLAKGNYNIRGASKFELLICFFATINGLLIIIAMTIVWLTHMYCKAC